MQEHPVEDNSAAAEQRGEDHEEHQREREREERRLRVPPERSVRVTHLPGGERNVVHVPTSEPVSCRYTSSRVGSVISSASSSRPWSSAHPVRSCTVFVVSLASTCNSRVPSGSR